MYLNENTYIQVGLLNGLGIGMLYYNPNQFDDELNDDEWYESYDILLVCFFIKITRW